jgi:hypothetical protein
MQGAKFIVTGFRESPKILAIKYPLGVFIRYPGFGRTKAIIRVFKN